MPTPGKTDALTLADEAIRIISRIDSKDKKRKEALAKVARFVWERLKEG